MSYCSECGYDLLESANFCPQCGVEITLVEVDDESETSFFEGIIGLVFLLVLAGLAYNLYTPVINFVSDTFFEQSESDSWQATKIENSREALQDFITKFPDSTNADEARRTLAKLEVELSKAQSLDDAAFNKANKIKLIKSYHEYVQKFPKGRHYSEAVEGAWESARRQGTAAAYEAYIYKFWNTKYRKEANEVVVSFYKEQGAENLKAVKERQEAAKGYLNQIEENKQKAIQRVATQEAGCLSGKCADGHGTWMNDDGAIFVGYSDSDGKQHGEGIKNYYSNGTSFEGTYSRGIREGSGIYYYRDGDVYQGEFQNDKRNGNGEYRWVDGEMYVGSYVDGLRHGKGTMHFERGGWFVGSYDNDLRNDLDGKDVLPSSNRYIGGFVDDKWTGNGRYLWADGRMYDGEFFEGKFHGKGKFFNQDGELEYYGRYENDERIDDGQGSLIGTIAAGAFKLAVDGVDKTLKARKKKRKRRR